MVFGAPPASPASPYRCARGYSLTLAVAIFLFAALAIGPPTASASLQRQADFWVSPHGSDRADGSRRHPFRTLAHARNAVRKVAGSQRRDVRVNLLSGTHRLARTLVLNSRDSGRNGHNVIYGAAPGAHPVISGARQVSGWQLFDAAKGIYRAAVPAGSSSRQLYVNGRRATRARGSTNPAGFTRTAAGYQAPDESMAAWGNPSSIEAVTLTQWKMMRCPVASVAGRELTMQQPCWTNVNVFPYLWSFQLLTRLENAYELLDSPGEWYLDSPGGYLYYMPRVGETLAKARVELPVLEALVDGRGTASRPLQNVRFEGLTFSAGTWLGPSGADGYAADQSGFHLTGTGHLPNLTGHDPNVTRTPGNVRLRYARRVAFVSNDFTNLGGVGLDFDTGSQLNKVVGNRFEEIASAAVQLGGVTAVDHHPTTAAQLTRDNLISNNLIKKSGNEYSDAAGIMVGFTTRTTVANNDISNVPWSGIAIGWGWGLVDPGGFLGAPGAVQGEWGTYTTPTASSGNRLLNNRIRRFLQVAWDGGAIYTLGQQGATAADGELIAGNVASNKRRVAGGNTFYTDGGSRYVTLQGNVSLDNHPGYTDFGPCGLPDSILLCWVILPYGSDRGGCRPYGDITYTGNYWQYPELYFVACPYGDYPVNVTDDSSQVITGSGELSRSILDAAGRQGRYRSNVGAP